MAVVPINVKLYTETDQDIIDFLKDKPNTFIVKESIRMYMRMYNKMMNGELMAVSESKKDSSESSSDIGELFKK
jgi:hypothetical protein